MEANNLQGIWNNRNELHKSIRSSQAGKWNRVDKWSQAGNMNNPDQLNLINPEIIPNHQEVALAALHPEVRIDQGDNSLKKCIAKCDAFFLSVFNLNFYEKKALFNSSHRNIMYIP
jgi:hypothetical protein